MDQDLEALREAVGSGDPSRAMPALARLREVPVKEAVPLLLLGLEQQPFLVRSLSCAGLGVKRSEEGRTALERAVRSDEDPNVRAEAANALVSHGVSGSWPLLVACFRKDDAWLVRCSILSALAEQEDMQPQWLLELGELAIADADGTVRVGGAEVLSRLARVGSNLAAQARDRLLTLQRDPDHRVVAAALNGLQSPSSSPDSSI